jgi:hypothetical protein
MPGKPSGDGARACTYDSRGQQGRRQQAHGQADTAAHLGSLASQMIAGLGDAHLAVGALLDEDGSFHRDRLLFGELQHGVKVALCQILEQVRRDQHILVIVAHVLTPPTR